MYNYITDIYTFVQDFVSAVMLVLLNRGSNQLSIIELFPFLEVIS